MNAANLQAAKGRLQEALQQLQADWNQTHEVWNDRMSGEFEETRLRPIVEEFGTALPAVAQLVQVVYAAKRALEES